MSAVEIKIQALSSHFPCRMCYNPALRSNIQQGTMSVTLTATAATTADIGWWLWTLWIGRRNVTTLFWMNPLSGGVTSGSPSTWPHGQEGVKKASKSTCADRHQVDAIFVEVSSRGQGGHNGDCSTERQNQSLAKQHVLIGRSKPNVQKRLS